jgi:hypothetical protein
MTSASPVDRVVEVLLGAKFLLMKQPLVVASVPFEFPALMIGTGTSPDLIAVVDSVTEIELRIRQKLDGFSRALDVAGSRRPLTAVIVGPKPSDATLEVLGRVCRVLPVGTPSGDGADAALRDWLAVLLPLRLPNPNSATADSSRELANALPAGLDDGLRKNLLGAASKGSSSVQEALKEAIVSSLAGLDQIAEGS